MCSRLLRALCAAAALWVAYPAHAQVFRTYLSVNGSDSNPCSLKLPCRLLPTALANTVNGGEVWILDSGNFNSATVEITRSVTVSAVPGAMASVVPANGPAININGTNITVGLRNIAVRTQTGTASGDGIVVTNARQVNIHDCTIEGVLNGVVATAAAPATKVVIANSTIRHNGLNGVFAGGGVVMDISRSYIGDNIFNGVLAVGAGVSPTMVAVTDSVLSANREMGLRALTTDGEVRWTAIRTTASGNSSGFVCGSDAPGVAVCTLGYSMATNNEDIGMAQQSTATFRSMGNNLVFDNRIDTFGTVVTVAGK
jgi:parallel beta helix pectate lyase-like protein